MTLSDVLLWGAVFALALVMAALVYNAFLGGRGDEQKSIPVSTALNELNELTGKLSTRLNDVEEQNGELKQEVSKMRALQVWLKQMLRIYMRGTSLLVKQIVGREETPAWRPPSEAEQWLAQEEAKERERKKKVDGDTSDLRSSPLRKILISQFDLSELQDLAFELRVPYENFPQVLNGFARELIGYCERRQRLDDLIEKGMELRPKANWPRLQR